MNSSEALSVVIPTSPCPIHPSTEIIEQVIASIRFQLPHSRIYLLCDGVRPELEHRRAQYSEYLYRLAEKWSKEWDNLTPIVSLEHRQQSGLMRDVIDKIDTPLFLFCEHDAILTEDPIDWEFIVNMLERGENTVRLYWHPEIHPEHTYLCEERIGDFVKTRQYSGWPFVSRVDFYRMLLDQYFPPGTKKMLEANLYGPCLASPWEVFRTWIYCPQPNGVRFRHLNSRVDPVSGQKDWSDW